MSLNVWSCKSESFCSKFSCFCVRERMHRPYVFFLNLKSFLSMIVKETQSQVLSTLILVQFVNGVWHTRAFLPARRAFHRCCWYDWRLDIFLMRRFGCVIDWSAGGNLLEQLKSWNSKHFDVMRLFGVFCLIVLEQLAQSLYFQKAIAKRNVPS